MCVKQPLSSLHTCSQPLSTWKPHCCREGACSVMASWSSISKTRNSRVHDQTWALDRLVHLRQAQLSLCHNSPRNRRFLLDQCIHISLNRLTVVRQKQLDLGRRRRGALAQGHTKPWSSLFLVRAHFLRVLNNSLSSGKLSLCYKRSRARLVGSWSPPSFFSYVMQPQSLLLLRWPPQTRYSSQGTPMVLGVWAQAVWIISI